MDSIYNFFNSNFFQTLAVILGAFITFVIFKRQKTDEIRNAAALIRLEIDAIESSVENLTTASNHEEILQTAKIYQSIDWFKIRGILVSKIDIKHIEKINKFYDSTIVLEDARNSFKESIYLNRTSKIAFTQQDISHFLKENIYATWPTLTTHVVNNNEPLTLQNTSMDNIVKINAYISGQLDAFSNSYNTNSRDFIPISVVNYFDNAKRKYQKISNTPAYEELRKLGDDKNDRRWWILW